MAGDLVFGVLHGKWAVAGWTASALVAGGLAFVVHRRSAEARAAEEARPSIDQLPSERDLVGRSVLSQALLQQLEDVQPTRGFLHTAHPAQGQATVVVVHGAAGIGKTTLALHTAHRAKASYPDARLYIDLRGDGDSPRTSAQALEWFLRSLGVASAEIPRSVGDRAALFRSLANPLRMLVFLDNAHSAEQILPLIPAGPSCAVLITSRRALSIGNIARRRMIRVELPEEDEALAVLTHYASEQRIREDPAAALDIVQFCGRLPIALRIVGARLRSRPGLTLRHMCARLESERSRLRELTYDSESLQACLLLTYRDLAQESRCAFGLLACLPAGRLTNWHIARTGLPEGMATAVADELVETCMMESAGGDDAGPRYWIHDLIRVFAAQQYEQLPSDERRRSERELVDAYRTAALRLASARAPELAAEEPVSPAADLDGMRAAEWIAAEADRLAWAHARARELGMERTASLIAESVSYFLEDLSLTSESSGSLFAGDPSDEPRAAHALARARASLLLAAHDPESALSALSSETADADAYATARREALVARIHTVKSDFPTALDHMSRAVATFRSLGDDWHLLVSLEKLGELLRAQGRPEEAEARQREALALVERFDDLRARARLRRTLAETLGYLRKLAEAAELLDAAVTDFRRLGDRVWEAASLYALGKIYRLLGRRTEALDCYDKALDIFGPMGERLWVGRVRNARIRVLAGMGRMDRAQAEAQQALEIFDELGHTLWHAHTLRDVGWLHLKAGRPTDAVPPLESAAATSERAGDAYAEAMARHLLGVAYRNTGHTTDARRELDKALDIYRRGGYAWNEAACTHDLVRALRIEGLNDEADEVESAARNSGPVFARMAGRDGATAIPDED
jgi:tetratricopeptide (TPR) repeat protein